MYVLMLFAPIGLVSVLLSSAYMQVPHTHHIDTELIRSDGISNPFGEFINKCPKTPMSVVVDAALQCIDDTELAGKYVVVE